MICDEYQRDAAQCCENILYNLYMKRSCDNKFMSPYRLIATLTKVTLQYGRHCDVCKLSN